MFFALCGLATIHSVKAIGFKSFERLDTTGFEIIADGENYNINFALVTFTGGETLQRIKLRFTISHPVGASSSSAAPSAQRRTVRS